MVAISNILLLAATATAAVIEKRTFAQVQTDLKTLNTDTKSYTTTVKKWDGTVNNAIPIQNAFNKIDNDIKTTTTDANNSPAATSAQATTLINYINKTLEPSTKAAIQATIAQKAKFTAAGLAGTVCSDLQTLQSDENALGQALLAKTPSAQQSAAQAAQAKVAADIQSGINAFC